MAIETTSEAEPKARFMNSISCPPLSRICARANCGRNRSPKKGGNTRSFFMVKGCARASEPEPTKCRQTLYRLARLDAAGNKSGRQKPWRISEQHRVVEKEFYTPACDNYRSFCHRRMTAH